MRWPGLALVLGILLTGALLALVLWVQRPWSLEEMFQAWGEFSGSALGFALLAVLVLGMIVLLRRRIQQSEVTSQQLHQVLEVTLDAIVIADEHGRIRLANAAAERLFGYARSELMGQRLELILPPNSWDQRQQNASANGSSNASGGPRDLVGRHKSGKYLPVEFSQSLLASSRGTLLVSAIRDATRERQAEDSRRDQEAQLRLLFEQMPAILWTTDTRLQITSTMGKGLAELNLQPKQVIGMSLLEHLKKDTLDATPIAAHLQALRGEALSYEMEWLDRHFQVRVEPLRNPVRLITGTIGIVIDVTARKQAELALQRKQQEMMDFFETAAIGMHWVSPEGRILWANQAVLRLLGFSTEEYLGKKLNEFHADEVVAEELQRRYRAGESLRNHEARLRCKDGTFKHVLIDANPYTEDGKLVHTRVFLRDITDNKRLEDQLRQSQKMEAVGRLAGGVAHDFNNLLTIINGYSEMLLTVLPPEGPASELVPEIRKAGDRAARLVSQLLTFSRHQVHLPTVLDANNFVRGLREMLDRQLGAGIELCFELDDAAGSVKADLGQLERALLNLTANSCEAMLSGGRLTLRTGNVEIDEDEQPARPEVRPGPYVRISVEDTGRGMDEATLARVFEPFFTTKEQGKGMGLGLATAYGIINQSRGFILVDSKPGRGARFDIFLPRVHPNDVTPVRRLALAIAADAR
jgi:PAS domain S-box-containing protein